MKSLARIALTGLLALHLPLAVAPRSEAQTTKALDTFQCEKVQGYYATMAVQHSGRRAPLIAWASEEFSSAGYPPERRCREVTQRLNQARRVEVAGAGADLALRQSLGQLDGVALRISSAAPADAPVTATFARENS